jgi:hypothetical protein
VIVLLDSATFMPAQTVKIFVLYCKKAYEKMAPSRNGCSSEIVLTFRKSLGEDNLLFYAVKYQNFLRLCPRLYKQRECYKRHGDFLN